VLVEVPHEGLGGGLAEVRHFLPPNARQAFLKGQCFLGTISSGSNHPDGHIRLSCAWAMTASSMRETCHTIIARSLPSMSRLIDCHRRANRHHVDDGEVESLVPLR
jgi:hypothetical protein